VLPEGLRKELLHAGCTTQNSMHASDNMLLECMLLCVCALSTCG
jgi:hypothetical protein